MGFFNHPYFKETIENALSDCSFFYQGDIIWLDKLEKKLNDLTSTGKGYSLSYIKEHEKLLRANALETDFHNGLKLLDSVIVYQDKRNNTHFLRQFMITVHHEKKPLIYLGIDEENISMLQFLSKEKMDMEISSNQENEIQVQKVEIDVNDKYHSIFTSYHNSSNHEVLLEKYKLIASYDKQKDNIMAKELEELLRSNNSELKFVYQNQKLMYAISSDQDRKEIKYLSNPQPVWNIIDCEINYIIDAMVDVIKNQENQYRNYIKK